MTDTSEPEATVPDPNDPTSPDYAPSAGGGGGADYGSGAQFGADTYALYAAGRIYMPEVAGKFADAGNEMLWVSSETTAIGGEIGHSAFNAVATQMDVVLDAMGMTATRIYEAADAMVQIADSFVVTDVDGADKFNDLMRTNRDTLQDPPAYTDPPRSGDEPPQGPHVTPDEQDIEELLEDADIPNTLDEDGDGELDAPVGEED